MEPPLIDRPGWDRGIGKAHRKLLDALTRALETRNYQLEHVKWFDDGRSGHPVAGVIRHENSTAVRILKFCTDRQHQQMDQALQVEKTFVHQHLAVVEQARISLGAGRCAVFLRPTGDDVGQLESMQHLRAHGQPIDYAAIVRTVLADWNSTTAPDAPRRSVRSVLSGIVGRHRGPALRWIRAAQAHDLTPVALLAGPAGRQVIQGLLLGDAHGDLSSRNILIPTDPQVTSSGFQLIDYDHFSPRAPLARDPMHLLVALALDDFAEHAGHRDDWATTSVRRISLFNGLHG